jgi:hypothetical protein
MERINISGIALVENGIEKLRQGIIDGKYKIDTPEKYCKEYEKAFDDRRFDVSFSYSDDPPDRALVSAYYEGGFSFHFIIGERFLKEIKKNAHYADRFKVYWSHEYTHREQDAEGMAFCKADFDGITSDELEIVNLASKIEVEAIAVETIVAKQLKLDKLAGLESYKEIFSNKENAELLESGIDKILDLDDMDKLYYSADEVLEELEDQIKSIQVTLGP